MYLALKILSNMCNVNAFCEPEEYILPQGNPGVLYLRLVNPSLPCPLRFIPPVGSTLTVTFSHIDSDKVITRVAAMPFPDDDRSIWQIPILASDRIQPNSLTAQLSMNGSVYQLSNLTNLSVVSADGSGRFYC